MLWRSQTSFSWDKREEKETRGKGERESVKTRAFFVVLGQVFRNLRGKVMVGIKSEGELMAGGEWERFGIDA